jgi:hypothetical protein
VFHRRLTNGHHEAPEGIPACSSPFDIACSVGHESSGVVGLIANTFSPFLLSSVSASKGPSLSGVTQFHQYFCPLRRPGGPKPFPASLQHATLRPPRLTADYLLGMLCSRPRWPVPYSWLLLYALPFVDTGPASKMFLSRPARALLALWPANLLAHLSVDCVTRFDWSSFQDPPLASERI